MTTASAPRGSTPPVAIVVAEPGVTSSAGACPQTITSPLRRKRRGALSLAPAVSAERNANPSTLARSNGGTSIGARTSRASTRPSAAAKATVSPASGERSMRRVKRTRASSAETTSRNCSCRAARRIAAMRSCSADFGSKRAVMAKVLSRPRCAPDIPRFPILRKPIRRPARVRRAVHSPRLWGWRRAPRIAPARVPQGLRPRLLCA